MYYRPRCAAFLKVPIMGSRAQRIKQERATDMQEIFAIPTRLSVVQNDHNHADECSLTLDWTVAGTDPRMLDDAVVEVHLANASELGTWSISRETCRFIGLAKDIDASRESANPGTVELSCVDYTTLFLAAKPFGSSGVPSLDMSLEEAWRKIVSQTPGAEVLADRLRFEGLPNVPKLSSAVSERFAKLAKVATRPETDAWAVWQQCVGMLGLISFIRLDECIVTTATNYYTEKDAPVLKYGVNATSCKENRRSDIAGVGIGISCFDPITGKTIEALYPPKGKDAKGNDVHAKRAAKKAAAAAKALGNAIASQEEKREWFSIPGVTNPEMAQIIAERVWEERSRQELEGSTSTGEMVVETESGKPFDMLGIHAGDSIRVEIDSGLRQSLGSVGSKAAQVAFLKERGYSEDVARLIIANMENFSDLDSKFIVRTSTTQMELHPDGGTFSIDIVYVNRIEITGDTA